MTKPIYLVEHNLLKSQVIWLTGLALLFGCAFIVTAGSVLVLLLILNGIGAIAAASLIAGGFLTLSILMVAWAAISYEKAQSSQVANGL